MSDKNFSFDLETDHSSPLSEEQTYLAGYDVGKFQRPSVSVDIVIFTLRDNDLQVLLVRRKTQPFQNILALPGGFVEISESLEAAARRELLEETGVENVHLEQLYTFGDPERDPRTRVITVAYMALLEAVVIKPLVAGTDAAEANWFSIYKLPFLAFDHAKILEVALKRVRGKLEYTNIAYQLLPEKFTLTELQRLYQVILGKRLDKRNFRKGLSIKEKDQESSPGRNPMLEELEEIRPGGNFGPTKLYRFIDRVERIIK